MKEYVYGSNQDVRIQVPDGYGVMGFVTDGHKNYSYADEIMVQDAMKGLVIMIGSLLKDAPDVVVAAFFGMLRDYLWGKGVLNEHNDIAVSLGGKVVPLDEIKKQFEEEMQNDEKDSVD